MKTFFNKQNPNTKGAIYCSLLLLFIPFTYSCKPEEKKQELPSYGQDIIGLATPIQLQYDSTIFIPKDYFLAEDDSDTILPPDGISITEPGHLLTGHQKLAIQPLIYVKKGIEYAIPLLRSKKEKVIFTLEDPDQSFQKVAIAGSFNGWVSSKDTLKYQNGKWIKEFILPPGEHPYRLHIDDVEMLDPNNPDSVDNGLGGFNSVLKVGDMTPPPLIETLSHNSSTISIQGDSSYTDYIVLWQNQLLPSSSVEVSGDRVNIQIPDLARQQDRSFIRIWGTNHHRYSNDVKIPLENGTPLIHGDQLTRKDKESYILYFMMVDRFHNGNPDNDQPVDDDEIQPIANYYGGDLEGITQKIKDGYFTQLGINTIWLSPIVQNPEGAWGLWDKGNTRSKFSGYHGYWPTSSSKIDHRLGTDADLDTLIAVAHRHDMNILLDYVANHVHTEHPVIQQHPDWKTQLYLPDGSMNTERWDEYRLTTWFDTFLPTLDLEREEVTDAMSDSALYWFERFDIDGFRHDATKHIPEMYWRTLNHKLRSRILSPSDRSIYQIGETYGSPELIGSYISSGMLDAQFDFNVYDAAVNAFARDDASFSPLKKSLLSSLSSYGYHNLMGYISGNQDRTRFISYADSSVAFDEDPKLAGWSRNIENKSAVGYQKLAMLNAFNLTIPGLPVIYYGDEIGMPGANDPDNRRAMKFDQLTEEETQLKKTMEKLIAWRKQNLCFTYGSTEFLQDSKETLVYTRSYFLQKAFVVFNSSPKELEITLPVSKAVITKQLNGHKIHSSADGTIATLPPYSFDILMTQ